MCLVSFGTSGTLKENAAEHDSITYKSIKEVINKCELFIENKTFSEPSISKTVLEFFHLATHWLPWTDWGNTKEELF